MAETTENDLVNDVAENDPVKPANEERYNCPRTGAHFKFEDMCRRLNKLMKQRENEELLKPKKISK